MADHAQQKRPSFLDAVHTSEQRQLDRACPASTISSVVLVPGQTKAPVQTGALPSLTAGAGWRSATGRRLIHRSRGTFCLCLREKGRAFWRDLGVVRSQAQPRILSFEAGAMGAQIRAASDAHGGSLSRRRCFGLCARRLYRCCRADQDPGADEKQTDGTQLHILFPPLPTASCIVDQSVAWR